VAGRRGRQVGGVRNQELFPKAGRWEFIRPHQRRYQHGVAVESRNALKAEAAARLARLRQKKQDNIRLNAARCENYKEFIKIKPCRCLAGLQALLAVKTDRSVSSSSN
jgi:hypothetical protein